MQKTIYFVFIFFFWVQPLFSLSWPVADPHLSATFGQEKWGSFENGIEIEGDKLEVKPADDGETIFFSDTSSCSKIPCGLDNFIVIEHERKLRTLYGSIEFSKSPELFKNVTSSDIIGYSVSSGDNKETSLFFSVMDSEFEQFVNPLLLLNTIADSETPVIEEIKIQNDSGSKIITGDVALEPGDAEMLVKMYDPSYVSEKFFKMSPFKVHLFLNGEEVFFANFESIRYEAGEAVLQTQKELKSSDYYKSDGFVSLGRMNLAPGKSRAEILISDYSGNEITKSFQLNIND